MHRPFRYRQLWSSVHNRMLGQGPNMERKLTDCSWLRGPMCGRIPMPPCRFRRPDPRHPAPRYLSRNSLISSPCTVQGLCPSQLRTAPSWAVVPLLSFKDTVSHKLKSLTKQTVNDIAAFVAYTKFRGYAPRSTRKYGKTSQGPICLHYRLHVDGSDGKT